MMKIGVSIEPYGKPAHCFGDDGAKLPGNAEEAQVVGMPAVRGAGLVKVAFV